MYKSKKWKEPQMEIQMGRNFWENYIVVKKDLINCGAILEKRKHFSLEHFGQSSILQMQESKDTQVPWTNIKYKNYLKIFDNKDYMKYILFWKSVVISCLAIFHLCSLLSSLYNYLLFSLYTVLILGNLKNSFCFSPASPF